MVSSKVVEGFFPKHEKPYTYAHTSPPEVRPAWGLPEFSMYIPELCLCHSHGTVSENSF